MNIRTLTLTDPPIRSDDLLQLAEGQNVVIRTASGKLFLVAAVGEVATDDDFEEEIRRTSQQRELRDLLTQRAAEAATISASEARRRLGLS